MLLGARDSGTVAISRSGAAIGPEASGVVVVLPVYRSGDVPQSLDERQKELLGFARASIALPDLIASAMPGPAAAAGLDVYIYDDTAEPGSRLLAYYPASRRSGAAEPLGEAEVRGGLHAVRPLTGDYSGAASSQISLSPPSGSTASHVRLTFISLSQSQT